MVTSSQGTEPAWWSPLSSTLVPSIPSSTRGLASTGYLLPLSFVPLKDRGRNSCTFAPYQAVPSKHHTAGFKFLNCGGNWKKRIVKRTFASPYADHSTPLLCSTLCVTLCLARGFQLESHSITFSSSSVRIIPHSRFWDIFCVSGVKKHNWDMKRYQAHIAKLFIRLSYSAQRLTIYKC